ncbi:MAG: transketolase, partial [Candidatus Magnetoovum sp. WYHC-5]|nr:transketolase [Candidatus Magnetoovum sp. WYHC-5]
MNSLHIKSINTIRMLAADAVQKAKSGHPGMPMGDADMAYVLWTRFLKHNPKNPAWPNRDRFVLSAGHGSMLLYSLLHLTGYNITLDDIKQFRQIGSKTPGHPEYCPESGIEVSTGPLGFGFSVGVGMAMAERYLSEIFNKPGFNIVDYYIYAIVSDGDIMEGVSYEAASLAGHLKLGKLIYLYSDNKTTIDGSTNLTFTENVRQRFEAQHWHVQEVSGYNLEEIESALQAAKNEKDKPSILIVRTHLGYGSPNKQDASDIHGAPLGDEELRLTKENLGWPDKEFYIPNDVLENFRKAIATGKEREEEWHELFSRYEKAYQSEAALWQLFITRQFNEKWKEYMPVFEPGAGSVATRSASGNIVNSMSDFIPQLLGGSADLSPSNMTYIKKYPPFSALKASRNIHFGVREHAMGAIVIGMALSKMLIPYAGTYLVFSGYMLSAIRMASMMKVPALFILTHDSIGVGEDGPSHHPIEQLTTLRTIPNLVVIRPSDANETVIT